MYVRTVTIWIEKNVKTRSLEKIITEIKRKNNKTTASYQQPKNENINKNNNKNRTLIIGFSIVVKLMQWNIFYF